LKQPECQLEAASHPVMCDNGLLSNWATAQLLITPRRDFQHEFAEAPRRSFSLLVIRMFAIELDWIS